MRLHIHIWRFCFRSLSWLTFISQFRHPNYTLTARLLHRYVETSPQFRPPCLQEKAVFRQNFCKEIAQLWTVAVVRTPLGEHDSKLQSSKVIREPFATHSGKYLRELKKNNAETIHCTSPSFSHTKPITSTICTTLICWRPAELLWLPKHTG